MRLLFCADPLDRKHPDPMYADEAAAAREAGLEYSLLNFEALVDERDAEAAARLTPP